MTEMEVPLPRQSRRILQVSRSQRLVQTTKLRNCG